MYGLKLIATRIGILLLIIAISITALINEWPLPIVVTILGAIFVLGIAAVFFEARSKQLALLSLRLKELAGYFHRRFMSDSSQSIFKLIDTLYGTKESRLWEWARICDSSRLIFNAWSVSFEARLGRDSFGERSSSHIRTYLSELWLMNNHYYELVEQFHEIGQKVIISLESRERYNTFVVEYNAYVQNLRDLIADLKQVVRTEIETPSVNFAKELAKNT